ncbi:DUF3488 and transglutaminase-like domain-containing protein [Simiduia curdlanivorans]|uniref:DUF3488 and DUF4129 domain-containing transglutaminase family protein n=1 Tax=Simiduia curdlanivorans TaxID=1492769 RepID=A0ABV8V9U4_9GAMM|nr:DUF3488 and transglutaminase-like domain-containing protein [Simiduia curdlanivorans]MDN3639461.1 DUF3488 and transglutaminase-like domain-containing protein [Simiduia curdlanivorans]
MLIDQIPRNSLLWLLFSLLLSVAPHLVHLPIWVVAAGCVVFYWRWKIHQGVWSMPGKLIKLMLVLVCAFGVWQGYGSWRGVEPTTGLLIVGMLLKLLEMKSRRDALLVVFLGFFTASAQLLFSQLILDTLYAGLCFWCLLGAQQLLFSEAQLQIKLALKKSALMLAQAIPIMLVLFLMTPRIAPLWSMPSQKHAAKTGISETMAPGDVVDLTKSARLAFRVSFDGATPPPAQRYWRGLVLSEFDGRAWKQRSYDFNPGGRGRDLKHHVPSPWRAKVDANTPLDALLKYQILMEPTNRHWLFTLGAPLNVQSRQRWLVTIDQTVETLAPIQERQAFMIESVLQQEAAELHPSMRKHYLSLPEGFNPRTLELAKQWAFEAQEPGAIIARFNAWIRKGFVYTLQPPPLGRDSVDDFLFETQRGFCEHFASSFVVFARAAGIPARVVTGYQGGELAADGDYLLVHQMDAHAWAEVWVDGQWLRVDPTGAVAPQRIEGGLREAMADDLTLLGEPLSLMRYSHLQWLNSARLQWDELNYYWQSQVVGFDQENHRAALNKWFSGMDSWQVGLIFLAAAALPLILLGLWMMWQGRPAPLPPVLRLLKLFEKRLPEADARKAGEPLGAFFARLGEQHPEQASQLQRLSLLFDRCLYAGSVKSSEYLKALKVQILAFKAIRSARVSGDKKSMSDKAS